MTSHSTLTRDILEIGFRFDNADSLAAGDAARNIIAGKPAFWSQASGGHAPMGILLQSVNRLGSLKAAIAECNDNSGCRHDYGKLDWLDCLIPLNGVAVADLLDAYAAKKSFRTAAELFARMDRIGFAEVEAA